MPDLLKFMTCGSVDDGKSTLMGRLLYDARLLFADQEKALADESRGRRDGTLDYSLLLDGLIAEREQGITIDVAYRYFSTAARSFIVADTPGHEEYTRNMAVGASFADLAVLLIDASRGIRPQTRRHLRICFLTGIRHIVFAVNKMDLAGYDEAVFRRLESELAALAEPGAPASLAVIPVSAALGDNVASRSANMPWYTGPALLQYLEKVDVRRSDEEGFILPVQRVSRYAPAGRSYQGQISCGSIHTGDTVTVLPDGTKTTVRGILAAGNEASEAGAGEAVSLTLADELDLSRGSVIARGTAPQKSDLFVCTVLWMDDMPLVKGRRYIIKLASQVQHVVVMKIKHREDINTGNRLSAGTLRKNEIGDLELAADCPLVFDAFSAHRTLGRFILIDRLSNQTSACGIILHPLRRADNVTPQETALSRGDRARLLSQTPKTIWFTGLSGSGKTALANGIEQLLAARGLHTMLLDGDNIRMGLNRNLGFTEQDRVENIRRAAETAKLMNDAGLIVLASFISPYEADRETAREIIGSDSFIEVYVSTPLEECERRDVRGLYKKARSGVIPNFTGIGSPYEPPVRPDITVDTSGRKVNDAAAEVLEQLDAMSALL